MSYQLTHWFDPFHSNWVLTAVCGQDAESGHKGTTHNQSIVDCDNCLNWLNPDFTKPIDDNEQLEYFSSDSNIAQALSLDQSIKKAVIMATQQLNAVIEASRIIANHPNVFDGYKPIRSFLLDHNLITKPIKNAWIQPETKRKETNLYSMGKEIKPIKFKNGRGRKAVYVLNLSIMNYQLDRIIHKSFKLTGSQKVKNLRLVNGNLYNNGKLLLKVKAADITRFGFYRIGTIFQGKFIKN